jgi:hypothetical protein
MRMNIAQSTQLDTLILPNLTNMRDKVVTACYGSARHERGACQADVITAVRGQSSGMPLPLGMAGQCANKAHSEDVRVVYLVELVRAPLAMRGCGKA